MGSSGSQMAGGGAVGAGTAGANVYNQTHRPRSTPEQVIRGGVAATGPVGAAIEVVSEMAEANGHLTRENYQNYHDQNIMQHTDPHEQAWDAMNRATDPGP